MKVPNPELLAPAAAKSPRWAVRVRKRKREPCNDQRGLARKTGRVVHKEAKAALQRIKNQLVCDV